MTHDINSDPEMWELRELYGDRAALIWLECLSIADRNSGVIGPVSDQTRNQLAAKCRSPRTRVGQVLDWCRTRGWLVSDTHWRVAKWRKYNKSRESDESPSETSPSPNPNPIPSETLKNQEPAKPEPSADSKKSKELDPGIKAVADRIFNSDRKKFLKLIVWIKQAEKYNFSAEVIMAALLQFEPYAADVRGWYEYLDKILYKADKDFNRDQSLADHERHKAEVREISRAFGTQLKGLVKNA